jgi:hypothetical protein
VRRKANKYAAARLLVLNLIVAGGYVLRGG